MRTLSQQFEKKLKHLGLVTLLMGGLAVPAFAEPSPLSLPALPALPGVPAAPQLGGTVNSSPAKLEANSLTNIPAIAPLPNPSSAPTNTPTSPASVLAPPPNPEANETAQATPPATPASPSPATTPLPAISPLPPLSMPTIPLPAAAATPLTPLSPLADGSAVGPSSPTTLKNKEKAPIKTWQTPLAPVVKPLTSRYNYRRQMLPETIYAYTYNLENRHLPPRVTRAEYEGLLFASIAQGELEVARALLNAGTDINAVNTEGETPRRFAERIGAERAAALLGARGGQ